MRTQRLREALDSSSSALLVTNLEGVIIFANRAASSMFEQIQDDVRRLAPQFDSSKLVGSSIDEVYRDPRTQRGLLQDANTALKSMIEVGSRRIQLSTYPVSSSDGERLGYVVEWLDRSLEDATEREVQEVIAAAAEGNLTQRVALAGKNGFVLGVARSINSLLETNEQVIGEVSRVMSALAGGKLTERIHTQYKGAFDRLGKDANATVDQLVGVVQKIQLSADMVSSGGEQLARGNDNLSQRTTEQASALEETAAAIEQLTSTIRHNADNCRAGQSGRCGDSYARAARRRGHGQGGRCDA